jgi:CRISPR type III-A-associated RAMP protein Csm5
MNNVKIETLTPVHVGSGNFLYSNMDFFPVLLSEKPCLAIVSEDKIGKLLGEALIEKWLEAIAKKESISQFMRTHVPEAKSRDYSKRRIPLLTNGVTETETLKEQIHDGMGLPYIPGSSIKGAIRTAILASLSSSIHDENIIIERDSKGNERYDKKGKPFVSAKTVEKKLFGKDPNNDVFRFIQVGDAYFTTGSEVALRLVNLNIRGSNELRDESKRQLVEAIGQRKETFFQMKIALDFYRFAKNGCRTIGNMPVETLDDLFRLINEHTRQLVEEEIDYWNETDKNGAEDYVENMAVILGNINACRDGKSCVLRLGHASGWRFITGAWTEGFEGFEDTIVYKARPMNERYEEYDFPKSRRIDESSGLLGFVKLSLC